MFSGIVAGLLRAFLSRAILKALLRPVLEYMFEWLEGYAANTETDLDDAAVPIFRKAVLEFLNQW